MEAFINGVGNISPQKTYDNSEFLENIVLQEGLFMECIEPDYKQYIKPIRLRRMGKILKMGVTAAGIALREAGIENPDAIITGTGIGMVQDTEKFLRNLIDQNEKFLTPTSFIQSTHNTVGAHIAVNLKCNNYNSTYVHNNISFENALLDSMIHLEENSEMNILLGGLDEMTENHYILTDNANYWVKYEDNKSNEKIIAGQGAVFFVLSKKQEISTWAKFKDIVTFRKPESINKTAEYVVSFLQKNKTSADDIDVFLTGQNDFKGDSIYSKLKNEFFKQSVHAYYKNLCGEYYTASAFASWLAAGILKHQKLPKEIILKNSEKQKEPIKQILIYNHFKNLNHSLVLLSAC